MGSKSSYSISLTNFLTMSNYFPIFLLFTMVALTAPTTISTDLHHHASLSPALSPSPATTPPPPSPPEYMQQQQLKNILDALIGSGDFTSWLNLLLNPTNTTTTIPSSATIFLPGNDAISSAAAGSSLIFDPFIIPYHILPHHFTFSDLQLFKTQTRLPTLLPSKTIIITDNSPHNFTIDDSLITHPDLYSNDLVSVHGIDTILDYNVYGDALHNPVMNLYPPPPPPPPLLPVDETPTPATDQVVSSSSNGACIVSQAGFLIQFLVTFLCFSFLVLE